MAVWWFCDFYEKHLPFFWHDLMECPGYKHLKHKRFFHRISFLSKSVTMVDLSEKWFCLQNEHFNTRDPVKNESVVKRWFWYAQWSWFFMNEQLSWATISSFNISKNSSIFHLSVPNVLLNSSLIFSGNFTKTIGMVQIRLGGPLQILRGGTLKSNKRKRKIYTK